MGVLASIASSDFWLRAPLLGLMPYRVLGLGALSKVFMEFGKDSSTVDVGESYGSSGRFVKMKYGLPS